MKVSSLLKILLIFQATVYYCSAIDINNPKVNLDFFVRTLGSRNHSHQTVNYINGTIFSRVPGQKLHNIFNFEGYNIGRKIRQDDGSYITLSREFVVYRDPMTQEILTVWSNQYSHKPNEVFFVANDPVNGFLKLGNTFPTDMIPGGRIAFNLDFILEYPNPLSPSNYPQFSAGPVYDAAELFAYTSNFTKLVSTTEDSVPMTGTWFRKSEFLPWMEMGTSPGNLFYTTMFYKCNNGLSCVANDVMELISEKYPKYKEAPSTMEVPNETSWTQFKKVVDSRRKQGLPDVKIPQANITANTTSHPTAIDNKILHVLMQVNPTKVYFNGTAWSETPENQPINLFNFEGTATINITFPKASTGQPYIVLVQASCSYKDTKTGQPIQFWKNPLNGKTVILPAANSSFVFNFPADFVYSMDIPTSQTFGLITATSSTATDVFGMEAWSVNMADLIFDYAELEKEPHDVQFYGTWGHFSSWPSWMEMDDQIVGNLVAKATVYRMH